jgi:hypothetical protein
MHAFYIYSRSKKDLHVTYGASRSTLFMCSKTLCSLRPRATMRNNQFLVYLATPKLPLCVQNSPHSHSAAIQRTSMMSASSPSKVSRVAKLFVPIQWYGGAYKAKRSGRIKRWLCTSCFSLRMSGISRNRKTFAMQSDLGAKTFYIAN